MKKCPFCAEEIQDEAIKCKHCNEFLNEEKKTKEVSPWYFKTSTLVWGFIVLGPLIPFLLPLVWCNPRYKIQVKVIITVIIVIITWFLIKALFFSVGQLNEYLKLLEGVY